MLNHPTFSFNPRMADAALYVYIGLAQADGPIEPSEKAAIYRKLAGLDFYAPSEINKMMEKVLQEFAVCSPPQVWENIEKACLQLCHTEGDKQGLLSDLEDIMECDGRVKELEMNMFRRIHTVLG